LFFYLLLISCEKFLDSSAQSLACSYIAYLP